ncbi:MAG TPA: hypothetical protein VNW71_02910, partial [Thermoanaerobaculia bacterium]|nr:hypothetical protein [Thermoanaerobaculia bacterium]
LDQPYRNAAINFLEEQKFPADEPNEPYDDVAWTWPLLYGVEGSSVADRKVLDAAMEPLSGEAPLNGRIEGTGDVFLLRDTGQTSLLRARQLLGSHQVDAAEKAFEVGGISYPPGSWIVQAPREAVDDVALRLGLAFTAVSSMPDVQRHVVDLPRMALLQTWVSTQDAGWARYTLDREGFEYALITDGDLRRGGLEDRFDVILFPQAFGDFARLVHGIDPKWGPLAYTKTDEYPSHGIPNASDDITGGMGFEGLLNLQRFVERGGVLVALGNSGVLPVQGGLVRRVRNVAGPNTPGSELRAKVLRPEHPIVYGYEERPSVFRGNGPLWDVDDRDRGWAVLQFGTKQVPEEEEKKKEEPAEETVEVEDADTETEAPKPQEEKKPESPEDKRLVLSGFVQGEAQVDGKPAVLDVPVGKGRVVLFAFNPLHRYLNLSDFRLVYNVLLNWNDLP